MSVTAGAGARPVPLREADSVAGEPLSVIVRAADRTPAAEGVKEISTEQEVPVWRTVGAWQESPVIEKSDEFIPVMVVEFRLRA